MATPEELEAPAPEMQAMQQANQAAAPPTRIYLIRHGEPNAANLERHYGQIDVPLSERGRRQSAKLAERLCDVPFDAVYSSDLTRAAYLAELLAEPRELPVRKLSAFRERKVGILEGMTEQEMAAKHPVEYAGWNKDRVGYRVPEGETMEDVAARVVPAIEELVLAFRGRRVAVAMHAGPIRVATAHALGLPIANIFRIDVAHTGLFVLEFRLGQPPRVTLMNG